jgi:hypothetical protein
MLKRISQIAIALVAAGHASLALGHGHPIAVTATNNRLVVSGGIVGAANGYANQIYVETGSEGEPQDVADFTNFGSAAYWNVPGFEISGLAENSGLYLQALARPVKDTTPVESRVLWYRNDTMNSTDPIALAPADSRLQIRRSSTINITLTPTTTLTPPSIKIAAPLAVDMGYHNHELIRYLLPYPLPESGAYAFFARLTSDIYAPSDPFLVVLNNGFLDGTQMLDSAAMINRSALLAGDYNHDDTVDAADYVLWRKTLNSTSLLAADESGNGVVDSADFGLWRENYGRSFSGGSSGIGTAQSVPEPAAVSLAILAGLASCARRLPRRA